MLCRYAIPREVSMVMRRMGLAHVILFSGFRSTANRSPLSRSSVTKQLHSIQEPQATSQIKSPNTTHDRCFQPSTYMFEYEFQLAPMNCTILG